MGLKGCGIEFIGKQKNCRFCSKKCYLNFWYLNNKNRLSSKYKKRYLLNRGKIIGQARNYRLSNKEKRRKSKADYYKRYSTKLKFRYSNIYWDNRKILLYILNQPCIECGSMQDRITHHIIPFSKAKNMGWTDAQIHSITNLEVRCKKHHKQSDDCHKEVAWKIYERIS